MSMRSWIRIATAIVLSSVLGSAQNLSAPERKDALEVGTVAHVEAYSEGRIFDWMSWVPVYDNYPYYDITIRAVDREYVVRYEAPTGYYPAAWEPGNQIKFQRKKGVLLLLRYDGELVPARMQ